MDSSGTGAVISQDEEEQCKQDFWKVEDIVGAKPYLSSPDRQKA